MLIKCGKMLSLADILIASTAISHRLILITRNIEHFKRIPRLKVKVSDNFVKIIYIFLLCALKVVQITLDELLTSESHSTLSVG